MKRVHYDLRIAHANGAEIERLTSKGWVPTGEPTWDPSTEYRVKPEPVQDIEHALEVSLDVLCELWVYKETETPNLRLTFDGETRELILAEVIK